MDELYTKITQDPSEREFVDNVAKFQTMDLDEKLAVVAELKLDADMREIEALRAGDKLEAKLWKARSEYWKAANQNVKKLIELEIANKRLGL